MSRRHELQRRRRTLGEIDNILGSMRMLSLLEIRKLSRFIDCQRRVVATQRAAAADFLSFHPPFRPAADRIPRHHALVVVGSERGFCGDFNTALRDRLERQLAGGGPVETTVFALGRKLAADLESSGGGLRLLDGPGTAEEVPDVLQRLVGELEDLFRTAGDAHLTVIHHGGERGGVIVTPVIPAFVGIGPPPRRLAHPPRLYLSAEAFFAGLVEQHLFAVLHEIVFASLLQEHQRRVQHIEGATQRLDEMLDELGRQNNALRQEEITEELQVILLGVDLLGEGP